MTFGRLLFESKGNQDCVRDQKCAVSFLCLQVDMIPLAPTLPVAFHAEKFSYKTFTFIAFGLGEQDGFGNPWEDFYKDCHGK